MPKFTFNNNLPKNIPLLIKQRVYETPDFYLQAAKNLTGKYKYYTYKEVYSRIISFALMLKKLGVGHNSNVAFISDNRKEWLITDLAIQSIGGTDVPRGCDSQGKEIRFIISFADCETGVFENGAQLKKVLEAIEEVPLLKTAILFDRPDKDTEAQFANLPIKVLYFNDLLEEGRKLYDADPEKCTAEIEADMETVEPEDNATIIFTSGTTGVPKGVMLTQYNYMTQLSVFHNFTPCKPGDMWLSVLPVWHSFERVIQYVAPLMYTGIAYSKPIGSMMLNDMAVIHPNWMCGVPRIWEALSHNIDKAMCKQGGLKLKLYQFFINTGAMYANAKDKVLGRVCRVKYRFRPLDFVVGIIPFILLWPLHKIGDVLFFKEIKNKFGGKIKYAISGGGALQENVEKFYRAVGFPLIEAYGLSETSPVISCRYHKQPRPGNVGSPFPTFEVKIVEEEYGIPTGKVQKPGQRGLLYVRGPQVMKGYYKRQDLTDAIIDKDGWLNTGDLALLTHDNEIKITGRAKDTIVLLGGENVEPAVIERELCSSEYIESAMIVGQDKKYLGALIVPTKDAVIALASKNNISYTDYPSLLKNENILEFVMEEVNKKDSVTNGFRSCDKIYKIALIPDSFKIGEELSAKQEMIRFKISQKYEKEIAELF